MKVSHALILLRKFILVCLLLFLLWQFYHYSVWVILEPNYEKFLIPGTDSLCFFNDFQFQSYFLFGNLWIPLKDLNGLESTSWEKVTLKNLTICLEMIANASSNVNSNVLVVSSNVLVDGMKILRWKSTNHFKICELYPSQGSKDKLIWLYWSSTRKSRHSKIPLKARLGILYKVKSNGTRNQKLI